MAFPAATEASAEIKTGNFMRSETSTPPPHLYADLPNPLEVAKEMARVGICRQKDRFIPDEAQCVALWDKYGMLDNIRRHSRQVAKICAALAKRANELGFAVSIEECLAAGLLHDLAKTRCLEAGGSHAQLGSAWIVAETGNYLLGQAALLHVHWAWPLPRDGEICRLPFFLLYADKRVRHDKIVTLAERFEDLQKRYGLTEAARSGIRATFRQTLELQELLASQLKWKLDEDTFD